MARLSIFARFCTRNVLPLACRTYHKYITLLKFHIVSHIRMFYSLVMIIYRYRQNFLCVLLSDNIFIKKSLYFLRLRQFSSRKSALCSNSPSNILLHISIHSLQIYTPGPDKAYLLLVQFFRRMNI